MQLTQFMLSKAVSIQVAPYNQVRTEMQAVYQVEPGETLEVAHAQASAEFKAALLAEVKPTIDQLSSWERGQWLARLGEPNMTVLDDEDDDSEEDDWDDDDDGDGGLTPYPEEFEDDDEPDDDDPLTAGGYASEPGEPAPAAGSVSIDDINF